MEIRETRITSNMEEGEKLKEYQHTLYLCKIDDIWISTEIPK